MNEIETLATKLTLPCGLTLPNRLVKAAMEPCLAEKGEPTEKHFKLHSEWSRGGFGLIITENVQVDQRYLGTPHDIIIPKYNHIKEQIPKSWKTWSNSSSNIPTLIQLCHTGLQSCRGLGRKFWEPSISPISMRLSLGNSLLDKLFSILLFNYSKMMNKEDIKLVIKQFKDGALLAYRSGFQGVQLHCSHGYLLAQFMSPKTNQRTDEYGNSSYNRLRILFEIIGSIRESVPADFCLAIKLNSADFVDGGLSEDDALKNVEWIVEHGGVDLIEISGGTYENVVFMSSETAFKVDEPITDNRRGVQHSTRTQAREAFFIDFASRARSKVKAINPINPPLILLTGGFRTRTGMANAVNEGNTDLIGLGRPACLNPHIASFILDSSIPKAICPTGKISGVSLWNKLVPVKLIGIGFNTVWHAYQLQSIASGKEVKLKLSALAALTAILPSRNTFIKFFCYIPLLLVIFSIMIRSIISYLF